MKTPKTNFKFIAMILLSALAISACANKNEENNRVAGRSATGNGAVTAEGENVDPMANSTCSDPNMEWGKIYESRNPMNFESQVKAFVSATLDPKLLGRIDGYINSPTGVDLNAAFKFDSNGNLIAESSSVSIKIFDDFVNGVYDGQVIQPYTVGFKSAKEGYIERSSGNIRVVFQDKYGTMTFTGRLNSDNTVSGSVDFANTVAVSGYSPASGRLGEFVSYACSMIK